MVMTMCLINGYKIIFFQFAYCFHGGRWINVVYVRINVAESFPADKFFPVKVAAIVPELSMTFSWDISPFLVKGHYLIFSPII
jgi:hypothetical protein